MSFKEPKAPIVRIRKKQVKKKTKEKDVAVQLPVRASRSTRYSSLTPASDPQDKGRECCRHIAQTCFRIPLCRTICFRCILPPCFSGEGSDDEKDEDIPLERRDSEESKRTSDIPQSVGGAQGGIPTNIELVEIKTETVSFVPPPRIINEYRIDPCSSVASSSSSRDEEKTITCIDDKSVECPTYLEIQHVGKTEDSSERRLSGPNTDLKTTDTTMSASDKPLVLKTLSGSKPDVKSTSGDCVSASCRPKTEHIKSHKVGVKFEPVDISNQTDNCDIGVDFDDESNDYVNMSVLNIDFDEDPRHMSETTPSKHDNEKTDSKENTNYSKVGVVNCSPIAPARKQPETVNHDYLNLSSIRISESPSESTVSTTKTSTQTRAATLNSSDTVETTKLVYVNVDDYVPKVVNQSDHPKHDCEETSSLKEEGKIEQTKSDDICLEQNGVNGHNGVTEDHEQHEDNDSVKLLKKAKAEIIKDDVVDEHSSDTDQGHTDVTDQTQLI